MQLRRGVTLVELLVVILTGKGLDDWVNRNISTASYNLVGSGTPTLMYLVTRDSGEVISDGQ
ncbi:prepilin-type N-terminal cleavage/methylation domain-containing protein [Blastopirellula sp. JC732]|uniref:Prepilin-type N-terminal cleavage/methylation domain-containing protein n=1 Tax=Blastopirellula sediminis TaxID=2894196 RepID=A0A9X1MMG3_9BACT|nr:prepilin-type N-terminal cleavage/methylation domain-containing protein [Blastopirellula sediminis]MCC9606876.1 prepilin-type N-terminal cleavage/methylation domain-containing protein [Blastopirellula sediminis]MCC9629828.1 prepilin-type N-terminal cleavage/methylation domain-containing protein [Blastopirellula sediminis]